MAKVLSRKAIQQMISRQGSTSVTIQGSGSSGGGSTPSVSLGPLLTSLNAEAMPSAEGYLHWTGTAWEWTTPTSGDPVDLTPYAQISWVQANYATLNDISGLLTKSEADGYYAPISFVKPYLPLTAGSSNPLTGSLYITGNSGITWVGGYGMMCFKPTSGWAGVTSEQWGIGSHAYQGIIRSSDALERYDGTNNYTIYDSSNFDPLNYLRKDGGTVAGTLNVKTQLNVQSSAGANKVSIDGTSANIDIASGGQITFDTDSHIAHDATNDRLVIHGNNGLLIDTDTYVGSVSSSNLVATKGYVADQLSSFDGYIESWADGRFLKLTGGTLTGSLTLGNGKYLVLGNGAIGSGNDGNTITIGANAVQVQSDGVFTFNGNQVLTAADKSGLFTQFANYDGSVLITVGGTQKSLTIAYASAAGSANTAVNADKLDNHHASDFALASSLGNYLPLTGGTLTGTMNINTGGLNISYNYHQAMTVYSSAVTSNVGWVGIQFGHIDGDNRTPYGGIRMDELNGALKRYTSAYNVYTIWDSGNFTPSDYLPLTGGTVNGNLNVKGTIQAKDSNGNNKVIIYGTTGNIRAEKVYIGGSTSGYEAATHDWVTGQGYQANVIESVKVNGTALTPTNKAVDIPAATSDGSTFGVVAIGTGFTFDEDRLCVAEAPITMGFKRLNKSTSETWDANTMTVNGTQYALLTNYRATSEWANMPSGMSCGGVLQITAGSGVGYLSGQLAWDSNHNVTTGVTRKLYWRSRNSTGWGTDDWHTIAFEDWVSTQLGSYLPLTGGTLAGNIYVTGGSGTNVNINNGSITATGNITSNSNIIGATLKAGSLSFNDHDHGHSTIAPSTVQISSGDTPIIKYLVKEGGRHYFMKNGSSGEELAEVCCKELDLENGANKAAIYLSGGHVYARNSSGQSIQLI